MRRWTCSSHWMTPVLLLLLSLPVSCGDDKEKTTQPIEGTPVCQVGPQTLQFYGVQVGRTKDLAFTIKNIGGGTLRGTVTSDSTVYSILADAGYALTAGQEKTVTVRFAPASEGPQRCLVLLETTDCESVACVGTGTREPRPSPEMILVPAGYFTMGTPEGELGRLPDEIPHRVALTMPFHLSKYEITQAEWQSVMGWNDSGFRGSNRPVETVTWFDAVSYCNHRSALESYTPAYTITDAAYDENHIMDATVTWNAAASGYRLPTEAEWEYACRAGTTTSFYNGMITNVLCGPVDPALNQVGWYCANSSDTTHEVGSKAANPWGFFDMHGNVREWCWDWYGPYSLSDQTDPIGPLSGTDRMFRGGSYYNMARVCRSAWRAYYPPAVNYDGIGLRLARNAP